MTTCIFGKVDMNSEHDQVSSKDLPSDFKKCEKCEPMKYIFHGKADTFIKKGRANWTLEIPDCELSQIENIMNE